MTRVHGKRVCFGAVSAAILSACGGGSDAPEPAATISFVSVECAPQAVPQLDTTACSALVAGTGNFSRAVTWSADIGTIDAAGRFTAPNHTGVATITATSRQDSASRGEVQVRILPARSATDQTDDVDGHQVHVMYVVPSDGADRQFDVNGRIAASVERWNAWLDGQTAGRRIRVDTVDGALDVTFLRLERSREQMNAYGGALRIQLEYEIVAKGFDDSQKLYLVYYDGGDVRTPACGMGAVPPALPGTVSALFLTAQPNNFDCTTVFFAPTIDDPGRQDYIGIHEIFHTLGFVTSCAPNQANGAHVGDDVFDQMYVGAGKAFPPRLDVDRDDYFEHDIPDCPDLADSAFLEPLPAAPAAPIGWPYETLPELACADETLMQSSPGPATRIQVINATNETVNVYRLDTNGVRQLVRPLPSNEGLVADTIVNEPFVVSSTTNSCLGIFRAAAGFARAVIR